MSCPLSLYYCSRAGTYYLPTSRMCCTDSELLQRREVGLGAQVTRTESWRTLGKRFYLSEPKFQHLFNGEDNPIFSLAGRDKLASGYWHMSKKKQQLKKCSF